MNVQIDEALAQLKLQPGETYRTQINGHIVEVRALKMTETADAGREASQFAEQVMLEPWFTIPSTPSARNVEVASTERVFPSPFQLSESDLAPE